MKMPLLSNVLAETRSGFWGSEPGEGEVDVRVVRNGDLQEDGIRWGALPLRSVSTSEFELASLVVGDILITTSGDCGYTAQVESEPQVPTIASNFIRILRFDSSEVVPRFAFHFVHSETFRQCLVPYIRGTALKNLSLSTAVQRIRMPLPPMPQQRRIAEFLDAADALRARRRAALAQLDTLSHSIFLDMFGDPISNPRTWPTVRLEEICERVTVGIVVQPAYNRRDTKRQTRVEFAFHSHLVKAAALLRGHPIRPWPRHLRMSLSSPRPCSPCPVCQFLVSAPRNI